MENFKVRRVRGAQADMAWKDLGLVKITEGSARELFNKGVPLIVAPSKVISQHLFRNIQLVMKRYGGEAFERIKEHYNAHTASETGVAAFFVDKRWAMPPGRRSNR